MSSGSLGSSIRNGLKTDTVTMVAIASSTAAGTATRNTRTIRLWRAATGKARVHSGLIGWVLNPNSLLLQNTGVVWRMTRQVRPGWRKDHAPSILPAISGDAARTRPAHPSPGPLRPHANPRAMSVTETGRQDARKLSSATNARKCPRCPSRPGRASPGSAEISKQACASSVRPSRASMASSLSRSACRCSTSDAA